MVEMEIADGRCRRRLWLEPPRLGVGLAVLGCAGLAAGVGCGAMTVGCVVVMNGIRFGLGGPGWFWVGLRVPATSAITEAVRLSRYFRRWWWCNGVNGDVSKTRRTDGLLGPLLDV